MPVSYENSRYQTMHLLDTLWRKAYKEYEPDRRNSMKPAESEDMYPEGAKPCMNFFCLLMLAGMYRKEF